MFFQSPALEILPQDRRHMTLLLDLLLLLLLALVVVVVLLLLLRLLLLLVLSLLNPCTPYKHLVFEPCDFHLGQRREKVAKPVRVLC